MNAHLTSLIKECTITNAQYTFIKEIMQHTDILSDIPDDWKTATLDLSSSDSIHNHTLHIEILDEYPLKSPIFTVDLDLNTFIWKNSLTQAITDIKTIIDLHESIWRDLELLDTKIETLDKSTTLKLLSRRIQLMDNVILVVRFGVGRIPEITFTGNLHHAKRDSTLNAIENIERILNLKLPLKTNTHTTDMEIKECGICYLEGDEIECKNPKCNRHYHAECFLDWIRVAEAKVNLFSVAQRGKCVYCQEWIYVE